jgi:tetratricopeptide (TPR) repeat protein
VMDDDNRILPEYSALEKFIEACLEYDHAWLLLTTSRRALSLSKDIEIVSIGRKVQIPLDEGLPERYARDLLREMDRDGRLGIRNATDDVLGSVSRRCQGIPRTLETLVATLLQRPTWSLVTLLENEPFLARLIEDPARELFASLQSDQERLLMQAISIYDKPVPMTAVLAVLLELPIHEARDKLDKFVRNFVATYDEQQLFGLHPLDRQYAYSQIPDQGTDHSKQTFHTRAAQFYHTLRKPSDRWKSIEDVEPQLDEFRHLVCAEQYDAACPLLNEIDREYLSTWGYSQHIIKLRSQLVGHIEDRKLAGSNLGNLGSGYLNSGDAATAQRHYQEALVIARETLDHANECRWLGNLGLVFDSLGKVDQAANSLSEAYAIAKAIHDVRHEGRWLGNLTQVQFKAGKIQAQDAIENYRQAIAFARDTNDQRFSMYWYENLGSIFSEMGDLVRANEQFNNALETARAIGAKVQACRILLVKGEIHGRLRDINQQAECYEMAREVLGDIQSPADKANVLIKLAGVYADLGQRQRQIACYEEALQFVQDIGNLAVERSLLMTIGDVWVLLRDRDKAKDSYSKALEKAGKTTDHVNQINALLRLASISVEEGDAKAAAGHYEQALQIARQTGNKTNEAIVLSAYANALLNMGMATEAIPKFELTLSLVIEMNDTKSQSNILNRLGMAAYFLHDGPKAIGYFERNLFVARQEVDRDSESVALYNIGDTYHLIDDIDKAVPYYKDALAMNMPSTNYISALGLGIIALRSGCHEEARAYFEKSIDLVRANPMTPQVFHPYASMLGLALLAVGRTQEGLEAYDQALTLSPSREALSYALQDLQILKRVPHPIEGLVEAIDKIERARQGDKKI